MHSIMVIIRAGLPNIGMRVSVRFDKNKMYGGTITKVKPIKTQKKDKKGVCNITIQYDNGTSEVTAFPDPDIVVACRGESMIKLLCSLQFLTELVVIAIVSNLSHFCIMDNEGYQPKLGTILEEEEETTMSSEPLTPPVVSPEDATREKAVSGKNCAVEHVAEVSRQQEVKAISAT